jgi:adenylate cyclase
MNRGAFDLLTKPVDLNDLEITVRKTLDEIARVRELDRQRAAAERARANLARYFAPSIVEILAERDEPLARCAGRRSRFCSSISWASLGWRSA